jgi:hypothetical protein
MRSSTRAARGGTIAVRIASTIRSIHARTVVCTACVAPIIGGASPNRVLELIAPQEPSAIVAPDFVTGRVAWRGSIFRN